MDDGSMNKFHNVKAPLEAISFIKENYKKIGPKGCADFLGYTKVKVKNIVYHYKLFPKWIKEYTQEELDFIRNNYYELGPKKVAEKIGVTKANLSHKASTMGLRVNHLIRCQDSWNKNDISKECDFNDPFVVYFWGFFWADGHLGKVNHNATLTIAKYDFDAISDRFKKTFPNWSIKQRLPKNPKHKVQITAVTTNYHLHSFLESFDYKIKSGASAHKILNAIPENLRHYWWRGYFDGDGCFCFYPQRSVGVYAKITSCLLQDWSFKDFLKKISIECSILYHRVKNKENSGSSNLLISGRISVIKFMEYILQGESFGLSRKHDKYKKYIEYINNHLEEKRQKQTSRYRGVGLRRGYWVLEIRTKKLKKCKYYGKSPEGEILAAREYDKLAKQVFGDKAILNFPNE